MKKTSTNNRRKKLPLLLGALLIISVAAYGTRAYFSDSATQQADIALELGNVNISTDNTLGWKYTPLNAIENTTIDATNEANGELDAASDDDDYIIKKTVKNVRPGDSFTREYSVENTGSLAVKVKIDDVTAGLFLKNEESPFKVEIEDLNKTAILDPGEEKEYTVRLTVDPSLGDVYNRGNKDEFNKSSFNALVLDYTKKALVFEAIQTNADITAVNK